MPRGAFPCIPPPHQPHSPRSRYVLGKDKCPLELNGKAFRGSCRLDRSHWPVSPWWSRRCSGFCGYIACDARLSESIVLADARGIWHMGPQYGITPTCPNRTVIVLTYDWPRFIRQTAKDRVWRVFSLVPWLSPGATMTLHE